MPASRPTAPFTALAAGRYELPAADLARLLSPALVIHLDLVRANVARMLAYCGGPERWRPHVKTTKTPPVFAELLAAGVRAFKCATLREARCLLETARLAGCEIDLLLAYPLLGPALGELGRLAAEHARSSLAVLCEAPELVALVPAKVAIFVDVDPGMGRTGIPMAEREAIHDVALAAGSRFQGLHHYEGHLHGATEERREQCFACYRELLDLAAELERRRCAVHELVTSGTPAFLHALAYAPFGELGETRHRVSPGTVVFHDLRSAEENPELELVPAAVVLTRVVSHPRADVVTCDAGSKSIAAEAGDPCAYVLGHPGLVAQAPSEEHLPLAVTSGAAPARGAVLMLVPRHICPTVNLAEEAVLVENGRVHSTVPISARAHDLWARE
ncbi:MAG: D-TA family PLP-dependent enzyme [Planctomycetes bacterium]|nr:D-TA family PLP-dependent enzyme [Planctomycetota bacterium]